MMTFHTHRGMICIESVTVTVTITQRTKHHPEMLLWSSSSPFHVSGANFKKSLIRAYIDELVFSSILVETTPLKPRVERTAGQLM